MALRWIEGFEGTRISALYQRKYPDFTSTVVAAAPTGWQDRGNAIQCNGSGGGFDVTTPQLVASVENTWILGWAWMFSDASGLSGSQTTFPSVELHDGTGQQIQVEMLAYNESKGGGTYWKIQIRRGTTVLGTSTAIFNSDIWYYIEVKITVHPTTGSFETRWWRRNDTSATVDAGASDAGPVNTAHQTTAGADRVRIALNSAPLTGASDPVLMDDLYVCDDTGSTNNDYLGKQVIEVITPNANGNSLEWTLAGTASDLTDAWGEDGATQSTLGDDKRVTSDVTDQKELAAYTNLSQIRLVTVRGLLLHTQHKMDTSGSRNFAPLLRKTTGSPANTLGTEVTVSGTNVTGSSEVFEEDPNTSAPWTITDINAAEFGVQTRT